MVSDTQLAFGSELSGRTVPGEMSAAMSVGWCSGGNIPGGFHGGMPGGMSRRNCPEWVCPDFHAGLQVSLCSDCDLSHKG